MTPELTCYVEGGWNIKIRPAPSTRDWMDATPSSYAYRCLPLDIANGHGWEILNPVAFNAAWDGGPLPRSVSIECPEGPLKPVSLFGAGVLTFHVFGVFRTSPGWNLWASSSPNQFKDGISALTGLIETDWAPYTFTMNWKFTRPGQIRFELDEPFCFFFPIQRNVLNDVAPTIKPMASNPDLHQQFREWSAVTDQFHEKMRKAPPSQAKDQWQKRYYRGIDMKGCPAADHQSKIRLQPFSDGCGDRGNS
jgi:hypothetical protein